ncbi:glycosyltransferase family 4 protein [Eubacteriaceae bacterium ES2]|nr:glycosyltransferase family 4 protein [Eubacteriaceae bacterium ES2]
MKKALMMASVAGMIDSFNRDNIKILQSLGYQVEIACNFSLGLPETIAREQRFREEMEDQGINTHELPVPRAISKIADILKAYSLMKKLCQENKYDLVHCHSPIGGVIARLACRKARMSGTKVIYTAHGFHFYKGAPLKNWLLFYPVERLVSRFTDLLITINREDYKRAQGFHAKKVVYLPGIGVDTKKFSNVSDQRSQKRQELGIDEQITVILSVGELIHRKNFETALKAAARLKDEAFVYLFCGEGPLNKILKTMAIELGISDKVFFLGFRRDIPQICGAADLFFFPSYQEGLPVAVMEAMSSGLPVVASSIRGNTDLIADNEGGYLFEAEDHDGYAKALKLLLKDEALRKSMGNHNQEVMKKFEKGAVNDQMKDYYNLAQSN